MSEICQKKCQIKVRKKGRIKVRHMIEKKSDKCPFFSNFVLIINILKLLNKYALLEYFHFLKYLNNKRKKESTSKLVLEQYLNININPEYEFILFYWLLLTSRDGSGTSDDPPRPKELSPWRRGFWLLRCIIWLPPPIWELPWRPCDCCWERGAPWEVESRRPETDI